MNSDKDKTDLYDSTQLLSRKVELESEIARLTALHMVGIMLSCALHTCNLVSYFISGSEKEEFIKSYLHLAHTTDEFNHHFKDRLITLSERVEKATAILVVGIKKYADPINIDCNLCYFSKCSEFTDTMRRRNPDKKTLCTMEYMSFSSALSKGMQLASQLGIANFLTQSIGIAALKLRKLDADFAMTIVLEVGEGIKTSNENKMEINSVRYE
jgi:uncharacterized ferredoxin-like protein